MTLWRRLRVRLFASHVLTVIVGVGVMLGVAGWLTRSLFESRVRALGRGRGGFGAGTATQIQELLGESLNTAFAVGLGVAVLVAAVVAVFVGRRFVRPIDAVRAAADRMARGDYRHQVPVPAEEELAALANDMNMLGDSLARTEHRRTTLIGEVAHELRSPVTTITGYMEGLIDGVLEPSDEIFAAVASETARIQRLTEDLTLLSQAEEGTLTLRIERAELSQLLRSNADRLRPQYDHAGVILTTDFGQESWIDVDPARIGQVMANLLGNALTHTPSGGRVNIATRLEGGFAVVTVTDTGAGIPQDDLERIFERFVRIPNANHPAGRGIGLTIARSIARSHGGDLVAANRASGTGAVFTLTLPISSREPS
jgi:signal transduction histidine kinase